MRVRTEVVSRDSAPTSRSGVTEAGHVERVAGLFAREKQLDRERGDLRAALDRALYEARLDHVGHKLIAIAIIDRLGLEKSGVNVEKVDLLLRQRSVVAARRVSNANDRVLASRSHFVQVGVSHNSENNMSANEPILKSKTVTETRFDYAVPEDIDDHDHDLDDEGEAAEDDLGDPAAAPARSRRR